MTIFKPMILNDLRDYSGKQFVSDLVAGLIVAIIALPLSIALAIASGVKPEAGLYTAIVAGLVISVFGGSSVQIAGPTAAFATIVAGIVAQKGLEGLAMATILAGVLLVLMGLCRLGSLIKFIPHTITVGFTAGIAVTLVLGQLKDFLGVTYMNGEAPIETMEKMEALFANIGTLNISAVAVGLLCLAVLIIWPKIYEKIPASLLAVGVGVMLVLACGLKANTIGDLYTVSNALPVFALPKFSMDAVTAAIPDAITIALLAGIESLLSCVVADEMVGKKHESNTELIAQGLGNVSSALFGGIPATGAIARTAANIKNGGRTPIAGIVHAIVLLFVLTILMPYAAYIPMPAIAAILIMVAYNMSHWREFVKLCKTSRWTDILVLVVTFLLTVIFDLVVAIAVGLVMHIVFAVLFKKKKA